MYNNEELKHYGVMGTRWGVHRASRALSSATSAKQRDKAISALNKHRAKSVNKISQLRKLHTSLQNKRDSQIKGNDIKAAKLAPKAASYEKKQYGRFTSQKKAEKYTYKAGKLKAKSDAIKAKSEKTKAAIAKNEKMQEAFRKGINSIDSAIVANGKRIFDAATQK